MKVLAVGLRPIAVGAGMIFIGAVAELQVTGNLHSTPSCRNRKPASGSGSSEGSTTGQVAASCVSPFDLDPQNVLLTPLLNLQANTIRDVTSAKLPSSAGFGQGGWFFGSSEVRAPLYQFVQSPQLVQQPLPFQLLLVKRLSLQQRLLHIEVPPRDSFDSWFPGYRWSVVLCTSDAAEVQHLGWRFTPIEVEDAGRNDDPIAIDGFYALIVENSEEGVGRIAPRAAEAWMLAAMVAAGGRSGIKGPI